MKKQIATLLALSTAAACILTYQPTAVGAEEYSVLDNTDKLVQEALEDNTDELGDALYDSVTEGEIPLYEADTSSAQSKLEKAAIEKGMYKDTFSFANHLCTLSKDDFTERVLNPLKTNMTDSEISSNYDLDAYNTAYSGGLCYGMSAISVLIHNGELTPGDLQEGAETLYDVTLTDDVETLITYYNSLQVYKTVEHAIIGITSMMTKEEHANMFLDCAARCKEKGTYFMAGISSKKGGTHAVVGMDELSGNWTFDGISYDTCIVTYDSNCVKKGTETPTFNENACIYINSETKQFCIPAYDATSENGGILLYASDDDSLLTYKAPIHGTTETNTDVSEVVKWKFYNGGKNQIQVTSATKDGKKHNLWKESHLNYGDFIFFGKGSSFHLEKNQRAERFAFSINGEGYRLVRKDNPKHIQDWDDLVRDDVDVITPNPKTSGGARWNYLAAWVYADRKYNGDTQQTEDFVKKMYQNVLVLDSGARGATTTFVENGQGDVLVAWENEAYLSMRDNPEDYEIVNPSISILAQPSVAVVDDVVDDRGTRDVATEYLQYLYSDAAQRIAAKHYYRPTNSEILKEYADVFDLNIDLVSIQDFGGWDEAQKVHRASRMD